MALTSDVSWRDVSAWWCYADVMTAESGGRKNTSLRLTPPVRAMLDEMAAEDRLPMNDVVSMAIMERYHRRTRTRRPVAFIPTQHTPTDS